MAERLFNNDSFPGRAILNKACSAELTNDLAEKLRGRCKIVQIIWRNMIFHDSLFDCRFQLLISSRILEVSPHIMKTLQEPVPQIGFDFTGSKFPDVLIDFISKAVVISII